MGTRTLSDAEKAILGDAAAAQLEAGTSNEAAAEEITQGAAETTPPAEGQEAEVAQAEVVAESQAPAADTQGTEAAGEEQPAPNAEQAIEKPAEAPVVQEPPVKNAAPAVVAQSSAPAKPEVKAAPEPAPTVKRTDIPTGAEMNAISRRVMSILTTYAEQMAPRRPVTDAKIIEQQRLLFEALTKTINESGEDFEKLMKMVFAFFEENRAGVFHETRVFRGMDNIPLSANDRAALQRLINMFKLLANPQSRKLNLKQVDLHATLQYGITEVGRNRVLAFFGR